MMGLEIMCLVLKRCFSVHAVFMPGNVDLEQVFLSPNGVTCGVNS